LSPRRLQILKPLLKFSCRQRGSREIPGFPAFRGYVFWKDFAEWRTAKNGLQPTDKPSELPTVPQRPGGTNRLMQYSPRVAKILCDAGVN
jgi:hypothetical protein